MKKKEIMNILESIDFIVGDFQWDRSLLHPHNKISLTVISRDVIDIPIKPDWKILDINNLPDKWYIEGKYDFEIYTESEWRKSSSKPTDKISNLIADVFKYRYRPTPIKKTHEELAEEYMKRPYEASGIIKKIKEAFIAGRKSMEDE